MKRKKEKKHSRINTEGDKYKQVEVSSEINTHTHTQTYPKDRISNNSSKFIFRNGLNNLHGKIVQHIARIFKHRVCVSFTLRCSFFENCLRDTKKIRRKHNSSVFT